MNSTSILVLIVFFAVGYFIQPSVLPSLQDKGYGATKDQTGEQKPSNKPDDERNAVDAEPVVSDAEPVDPEPIVNDVDPVDPEPIVSDVEQVDAGSDTEPVEDVASNDSADEVSAGDNEDPFPEPTIVSNGNDQDTGNGGDDVQNPFDSNPFDSDPEFGSGELSVEEKTAILESLEPMDEAKIIAAMKDAVKKRTVKSFTSNQVSDWKKGEPIVLEGVGYNVGVVEYIEETIFGKQTSKVKALFEDGALKKWVWYSTHRPLE